MGFEQGANFGDLDGGEFALGDWEEYLIALLDEDERGFVLSESEEQLPSSLAV